MNASTATAETSSSSTGTTEPQRKRFNVNHVAHVLEKLGLGFFTPFVRLAVGDEPARQIRQILVSIVLPLAAFGVFVALWSSASTRIQTDSMKIPSPSETWSAWQGILDFAAREKQNAVEFHERMEKMAARQDELAAKTAVKLEAAQAAGDTAAAEKLEARIVALEEKAEKFSTRDYSGPPTFFDQIWTSLFTVAVGFLVATFIAVPLGILCGLSATFNTAINPLIQIFKPVSPLAWLPIVFVIVTALYTPPDGATLVTRAMLISAGTVTLCSLWPTLINTAVGVASIDPDHMNVAKVLKLNWLQRIFKIVLPSALPLMFTGMRLSLGVGWMVLIAADMLAQNPGLGKFVWDTFQNGSTASMAEIVCAVFAIGLIGFALDRIMQILQRLVSFDDKAI